MMKAALLLSALVVATGSAAFAAQPGQPQDQILTYSSSATSMGGAAVPVLPEANNANVPGATGATVVRGNSSTVAGDRASTLYFQTGSYGGGN